MVNLALTERDFTFDGEFFPVERPTTIATRPLQDRLPVWLGGTSRETMRLAAARGWNVMRNFGGNAEHRDALEDYVKVAAGHGHARSGANMMLERFVAIGETEDEAERNLGRLAGAFGQFLALYTASGRRAIPETDGDSTSTAPPPARTGLPSLSPAPPPRSSRPSSGSSTRPARAGCWSRPSRARRRACSPAR